jgi:hypothetical protein
MMDDTSFVPRGVVTTIVSGEEAEAAGGRNSSGKNTRSISLAFAELICCKWYPSRMVNVGLRIE